jgi:hypothetical protein
MVTGQPPFIDKGVGAMMLAHAVTPPPLHLLDDVISAPLRAVIARMLQKLPDLRPPSMTAVLDALSTASAERDEARSTVANRVTAPMETIVCDTLVDATVPDMPANGDEPPHRR